MVTSRGHNMRKKHSNTNDDVNEDGEFLVKEDVILLIQSIK